MFLRALAAIAALFLVSCGSARLPMPNIAPYRIEIQQGNFVSQEMVSQLKLGMSKDQVRFVLGTPLITDSFHADRWDYVFRRQLRFRLRLRRLDPSRIRAGRGRHVALDALQLAILEEHRELALFQFAGICPLAPEHVVPAVGVEAIADQRRAQDKACLLYTSDAADE